MGHGDVMHPQNRWRGFRRGGTTGNDAKCSARTSLRAMEASTSSPPPRAFFLASPKGTASGPDLRSREGADGGVKVRMPGSVFRLSGSSFSRDADVGCRVVDRNVPAHVLEEFAVHQVARLVGAPRGHHRHVACGEDARRAMRLVNGGGATRHVASSQSTDFRKRLLKR